MKRTFPIHAAAALIAALALSPAALLFADEAVPVNTESVGTITEFSPDTIVIHSEHSTEPLRYKFSKTTTYVDDAGNPVSRETIKSGAPVTVHYSHEGDMIVAHRVVVHTRTAPASGAAAPSAVEERKTTTTTTTAPGK